MKKIALASVVATLVAGLTACNNTPAASEVVLPKSQNNTAVVNQPAANTAINSHAVANQISPISSLANARDESMVRLQGKVVRALPDEKYEFADATGTVIVEIDHELWMGRAITPNDVITIVGEVDVEYRPTKQVIIDVQSIEF